MGRPAPQADRTAPYRILSDSPAVDGPDPLGFDEQVRQLERAIVASHRSAPFTVSVEAGWGAGKSSLMRRLQQRLDLDATASSRSPSIEVKTVWFNAWTAPESAVLEGLIRSVLDELDTNIVRRAARKKQLIRGLGVVASIAATFSGLGGVVDRVWARVSDDPKRRNELNDFVREAMTDWLSRRKLADGGLIVVFIDDLDRCTADTVLEVFEAVKLYLDAPGIVFVLGWDTEQVVRAVAEKKGNIDRLAHRYVEKIVQFGYRIRRPTEEQLAALVDTFCEQANIPDDVLRRDHRSLLVRTASGNPRQIKRFLNRFVLLHQIVAPDDDGSNATVESDVLILLLVLQSSYDGFYRLLAVHPDGDDDEDPGRHNPLVRFSDYERARRARDRQDRATLDEIVARHMGSATDAPGVPPDVVFAAFERDQPREFPELIDDRQFVNLVNQMSDEDRNAVWALARSAEVRGLEPEPATSKIAPPRIESETPIAPGTTVLWIDDQPKRADHELLPDDVEVLVATSTSEAERILSARGHVDLLISDIGRAGDSAAGINGLAEFRDKGLYEGPAVFYTSHPTTGQVRDAKELGALVTSQPFELQDAVRRYLPVYRAEKRSTLS